MEADPLEPENALTSGQMGVGVGATAEQSKPYQYMLLKTPITRFSMHFSSM